MKLDNHMKRVLYVNNNMIPLRTFINQVHESSRLTLEYFLFSQVKMPHSATEASENKHN